MKCTITLSKCTLYKYVWLFTLLETFGIIYAVKSTTVTFTANILAVKASVVCNIQIYGKFTVILHNPTPFHINPGMLVVSMLFHSHVSLLAC